MDQLSLDKDDPKLLKAIKEKDSSRILPIRCSRKWLHTGADDSQSDREILRWSDVNGNGKPSWDKRQQSGDYETASISSSLAGRYRKKDKSSTMSKPQKAQSELGGRLIEVEPSWPCAQQTGEETV